VQVYFIIKCVQIKLTKMMMIFNITFIHQPNIYFETLKGRRAANFEVNLRI